MKHNLIGLWMQADPVDSITLEFTRSEIAIYTFFEKDVKQYIFLTYKIEGKYIITDQPSHPKEEKTLFILEENKLKLYFNENKVVYKRIKNISEN
jgi:hypothetical protein